MPAPPSTVTNVENYEIQIEKYDGSDHIHLHLPHLRVTLFCIHLVEQTQMFYSELNGRKNDHEGNSKRDKGISFHKLIKKFIKFLKIYLKRFALVI